MRWLREASPAAVADALRMAAPDLAGLPVTIPSLAGQDDPVWQMSTAALGEDYIVKFAWSRAAAREEQRSVGRWCDWADEILARPYPFPQVLVHGDLHGDNQVWSAAELQVVLDFENAGLGEPEYELRGFPGPDMGPGVELLTATMRHYERLTGRALSVERIMAWHVRHALGDVLWRSEAGIPLADHRSPSTWVDD